MRWSQDDLDDYERRVASNALPAARQRPVLDDRGLVGMEVATGQEKRASGPEIALTILGEPCSKANSRRLVNFGERPASIKSAKALAWVKSAQSQLPRLPELLDGRLRVDMTIYYASERPDLDESLVLDVMQGYIYRNDRAVREKHIVHAIDKSNPRTEVVVRQVPK